MRIIISTLALAAKVAALLCASASGADWTLAANVTDQPPAVTAKPAETWGMADACECDPDLCGCCDGCPCRKAGKVAKAQPVKRLLYLGAEWCVPCRTFRSTEIPKLTSLGWTVGPQSQIRIVDIDAEPRIGDRANVTSLPTLVYVENGREIRRRSAPESRPLDAWDVGEVWYGRRMRPAVVQAAPMPVIRQTFSRPTVQRYGGLTWSHPGDLRTHLMTTHGLSGSQVSGLSHGELRAVHDNLHNGRGTGLTAGVSSVRRTSVRSASVCPNCR